VTTAPGVEAVGISTSGQASGDTAIFTYDNFSITSDAEKRYIQLAADVTTFDSGASGEIQIEDSDGDYVVVELNQSANQSKAHVLANQTGEGHVTQVQVGELNVQGTGDGVINEIQHIDVVVNDADIAVDLSLINGEKTSTYTFGEKRVDTDSDDDFETETIREPHGEYSVHAVSTFGDAFADATAKGLSYPATVEAQYVPSEDVNATFGPDDAYPKWHSIADIYYRMNLPDAYDISYSGVSLDQDQRWSSSRYVTVEVAEGVGDTDFADIDSWSSQSGSFDSQDATHTLDSTVSVGTNYAVHVELTLTEDESAAMQAGGAAMPDTGDDGGTDWVDFFVGLPGVIAVAATGVVGRLGGVW
jgi:hypothetical protein